MKTKLSYLLLLIGLTGCAQVGTRFRATHQPRPVAAYFLKSVFDKRDRTDQNRAYLHDRLVELSRFMADMSVADPGRYRLIESAYTQWSRKTGYGEDLGRLDMSDNQEVRQVLIDLDNFKRAAKPLYSRMPGI